MPYDTPSVPFVIERLEPELFTPSLVVESTAPYRTVFHIPELLQLIPSGSPHHEPRFLIANAETVLGSDEWNQNPHPLIAESRTPMKGSRGTIPVLDWEL
jgi:hypothetical protein